MHLTFALFFSSFFLLLFFFPQFSSSIVVYEGKVTNSVKEHRERKEGNASLEISQIPNSYHSFIFPSCLRYYQKKKKRKRRKKGKTRHIAAFLAWMSMSHRKYRRGGRKESALHQLSFLMLCSFCIISSSCLASTTVAWPPFSAVQKQNGKINRKRKQQEQQQQQLSLFLTLLLSLLFFPFQITLWLLLCSLD